MKTLVVYYSLSGNTKFAAETIAAELGADIVEIVDLKKRQGKLAFLSNGRDAGRGKETEIASSRHRRDFARLAQLSPLEVLAP